MDSDQPFDDRRAAGVDLASRLMSYASREDVVVLALPRGGVPVAFEVAQALGVPLDVLVVRKIGTPGQPELAMGALASGGLRVVNEDVVRWLAISPELIDRATEEARGELERRERAYRGECPPVDVRGRIAIVVDDGLATGSTMRAAVMALRQRGPTRVIVAVPVASADACRELQAVADAVVCARTPAAFAAVGQWYRDFSQTTDAEVQTLLARSRPQVPAVPK